MRPALLALATVLLLACSSGSDSTDEASGSSGGSGGSAAAGGGGASGGTSGQGGSTTGGQAGAGGGPTGGSSGTGGAISGAGGAAAGAGGSPPMVCAPNQQISCACPGSSTKGAQKCLPDGSGYTDCEGCPTGQGGAAGEGGTAGGSGGSSGQQGGAGSPTAGSGGSAGNGGASGAKTCPPAPHELPLCGSSDANKDPEVKCYCADKATATDCATKWNVCAQDQGCSRVVDCSRQGCGNDECLALAGTNDSLAKVVALSPCKTVLMACQGAAGSGG